MEQRELECSEHGAGVGTFICVHLLRASHAVGDERVGWVSDEPSAENHWPDAWCFACDEHLDATGGAWTDDNGDFADIQLVCHRCYERIRATNDIDEDDWPTFAQ